MDWTFWLAGGVIVVLVIVTQVFLHESRWSRRPRDEEPIDGDDRYGVRHDGGVRHDDDARHDDDVPRDRDDDGDPHDGSP